jgi:hypothetical protein
MTIYLRYYFGYILTRRINTFNIKIEQRSIQRSVVKGVNINENTSSYWKPT